MKSIMETSSINNNTINKEVQEKITPELALQLLKNGNERFKNNYRLNRNFLEQVSLTSTGQFPYAVILSCIDSRMPTEIIFDQGIGDIFNVRVAGNIVNDDVLGSIEFACKLAGARLVVVMGHTGCGAVKGAYNGVELDHLTHLLGKIKPAIDQTRTNGDGDEQRRLHQISLKNVELSGKEIMARSKVIRELHGDGEVKIVGAMYYVENGNVEFFEG